MLQASQNSFMSSWIQNLTTWVKPQSAVTATALAERTRPAAPPPEHLLFTPFPEPLQAMAVSAQNYAEARVLFSPPRRAEALSWREVAAFVTLTSGQASHIRRLLIEAAIIPADYGCWDNLLPAPLVPNLRQHVERVLQTPSKRHALEQRARDRLADLICTQAYLTREQALLRAEYCILEQQLRQRRATMQKGRSMLTSEACDQWLTRIPDLQPVFRRMKQLTAVNQALFAPLHPPTSTCNPLRHCSASF